MPEFVYNFVFSLFLLSICENWGRVWGCVGQLFLNFPCSSVSPLLYSAVCIDAFIFLTILFGDLSVFFFLFQTIEALSAVPASELALRLYLQCAEVHEYVLC